MSHVNECSSTCLHRYEKRRVQEELEALNSKVTRLSSHHEGGPIVDRLQEEIKEYKRILKCSVCHERSKEVHLHPPAVARPVLFFLDCYLVHLLTQLTFLFSLL